MTEQPDPRTEHAGVAAALTQLESSKDGVEDLDALPVAEHVERFHALHESLTAALAGIDGA